MSAVARTSRDPDFTSVSVTRSKVLDLESVCLVERVVDRLVRASGASSAFRASGRAICAARTSGADDRVSRNEQVWGSTPQGGSGEVFTFQWEPCSRLGFVLMVARGSVNRGWLRWLLRLAVRVRCVAGRAGVLPLSVRGAGVLLLGVVVAVLLARAGL